MTVAPRYRVILYISKERFFQMVRFYGAMFREGDVWICMEVMDTSLDKFYRKAFRTGHPITEPFVGRVALSVSSSFHLLF